THSTHPHIAHGGGIMSIMALRILINPYKIKKSFSVSKNQNEDFIINHILLYLPVAIEYSTLDLESIDSLI
uniref:hypothetical protein n=1 Tax=Klebsiella pneumoniae TaxID=573 RepID=UPI003EBB39AD